MAEVNTFFKQEFKQEDELKRARGMMVFLISDTEWLSKVFRPRGNFHAGS